MSYHSFKDESGQEYGSFEVLWSPGTQKSEDEAHREEENEEAFYPDGGPGFYWWACFPGCMPDGDPVGPFETEQEAIDDAQDA